MTRGRGAMSADRPSESATGSSSWTYTGASPDSAMRKVISRRCQNGRVSDNHTSMRVRHPVKSAHKKSRATTARQLSGDLSTRR